MVPIERASRKAAKQESVEHRHLGRVREGEQQAENHEGLLTWVRGVCRFVCERLINMCKGAITCTTSHLLPY